MENNLMGKYHYETPALQVIEMAAEAGAILGSSNEYYEPTLPGHDD